MRHMLRLITNVFTIAGIALLTASGGVAAPLDAGPSAETVPEKSEPAHVRPADPPDPVAERMIARVFARQARHRLRVSPNPSAEDYAIAAHSLRLARKILDNNIELLRQEIEAWSAAGAAKEVLTATRELIRLDPQDTVAQLRYISSKIDAQQTVEGRLAVARRFLGNAGRLLDTSVRSRIAFDAALLARELGDETGFLDLLQLATTLDVTNKQAATLFATYYLDQTDDPHDRVDLLLNVVLADPLDVNALENLSRELVRLGAFAGAIRFYDRMRDILGTSRSDLATEQLTEYLICKWNTNGHTEMFDILVELDRGRLGPYVRRRAQKREDDIDPGPFLEPVHPLELEEARLCALVGLGDRAIDTTFNRRDPELDELFVRPLDAPNIPKPTLIAMGRCLRSIEASLRGVESEEFRDMIADAGRDFNELYGEILLHRLWVRLLTGCELAEAEQDLNDFEQGIVGVELNTLSTDRYRGWLAGLQDDAETARALLTPWIDEDDQALWALAVTEERAGAPTIAAEHYIALANRSAHSALGTAARERASQLLGHPIARATIAQELNATALHVAPWFERMTAEPRTFMQLDMHIEPVVATPLEEPELIITLKNVSPLALGVGSDAPIGSRVLLTPRLLIDGMEVPGGLRQLLIGRYMTLGARYDQAEARVNQELRILGTSLLEMVDFDRRLRLDRNDSITVRVPASIGVAGKLVADDITKRSTLAWRATQGFTPGRNGFEPGPLSLTTQSPTLTLTSIGHDFTPQDAADLLNADSMTTSDFLFASSKFKREGLEQQFGDNSPDENLFETLLESTQIVIFKITALQRTLAILRFDDLEITQLRDYPEFADALVDAVLEAPTPIGLAKCALGATSSDADALFDALESDDPDTAAIARLRHKQILETESSAEDADDDLSP